MQKIMLYVKIWLRQLKTPMFFLMLVLAFVLWYLTKLGHTYTTELNIPVRVDRIYYSVSCKVEGVGYQILIHKIAPRKNQVIISSDNMTLIPSATDPDTYEIPSHSLQQIISTKVSNLKVISVESPVEIKLTEPEERS